jgi:hypothetical protein
MMAFGVQGTREREDLASLPAHFDPLRLGDVPGKDRQRQVVSRTFSHVDGVPIPEL